MSSHRVELMGGKALLRKSPNDNRALNELIFAGMWRDEQSVWFSWCERGSTYSLRIPCVKVVNIEVEDG